MTSVKDNWPDCQPIGTTEPSVDVMSEDMIPSALIPLLRDISHRMQVPLDMPAAAAVLCLAGITNRRARVQPKRLDTGWTMPLNLWGLIVAPAGMKKTPVMQALAKPIYLLQDKVPDKRIYTNDATFEQLHHVFRDNPAGLLVIRDEISGWLDGLDRQSREQERAFFLESWNGDNPFIIDRVGRGYIKVPACCVSLYGGIQPDLLQAYLRDGRSNKSDGLFERFQILVSVKSSQEFVYVDQKPDVAAERVWTKALEQIAGLDSQTPLQFRFDTDAQLVFESWFETNEKKVCSGVLEPAMALRLAKYSSLMPKLAALFQLFDLASSVGFGSCHSILKISQESAVMAYMWCDYLESHARRVYGCKSSLIIAAETVAVQILQKAIGASGSFNLREIYRNNWKGLGTPELAREAVGRLCEANYLRLLPPDIAPSGGRPAERYQINPALFDPEHRQLTKLTQPSESINYALD